MVHRPPAVFHRLDLARADHTPHLRPHRRRSNLHPKDAQRAGGRARATTNETDDQGHQHGKPAPTGIAAREKPRAGKDRGNVEKRVPKAWLDRRIGCQNPPRRHRHHRNRHPFEKSPHLQIAPQRFGVAIHHLHKSNIGHPAQDHENPAHILARPRIFAKGRVRGGKSPRRNRRKSMHHRVQRRHPDQRIADHENHGQKGVNRQQLRGDVGGARQDLAQRVKPFGAEKLHPPHPHHRQENHRDKRNPKPAQPVEHAAPQVHPLGVALQPDNHRRPRGRDARDRLEIGIGQPHLRRTQHKGQGTKQGQHHPDHEGQQKRQSYVKRPPHRIARGQHKQPAKTRGKQRRLGKARGIAIAHIVIQRRRNQHQGPQHQ